MTIATLPAAPDPSDGQTAFDDAADAWAAALPGFVTQANALGADLTTLAAGTALSLSYTFSSTTTDADPGAGFLRLDNFAAQTSATVIRCDLVDAAGVTQTAVLDTFDDSTSTVKGHIALVNRADASKWLIFSVSALASPSGYKNITVANVAGSSAAPFVDGNDLILKFSRTGDKGDTGTAGLTTFVYEERTSNTALGNSDSGKHINVTSGTFTQTFDAIAGFSANWFAIYENSGAGEVTLDPNASEQIDGLTSFKMYPGEKRKIQRNAAGTAFTSTVLNPFYATFTATGTFTKAPGYKNFAGLLWGGGASGAKGASAGGGGGGACVPFNLPASVFGSTESITIGAAVVGPSGSVSGTTGNTSSIGSLLSAYGGGPGLTSKEGGGGGGAMSAGVLAGGAPAGGAAGALGGDSAYGGGGGTNTTSGADGGNSMYGGGGGGAEGSGTAGNSIYGGGGGGGAPAGTGGTSKIGGAGGAGGGAGSGGDGTAPGGGGGGTNTGTKAGDGARGELRIWGVA